MKASAFPGLVALWVSVLMASAQMTPPPPAPASPLPVADAGGVVAPPSPMAAGAPPPAGDNSLPPAQPPTDAVSGSPSAPIHGRDPFWPVGYSPRRPQQGAAATNAKPGVAAPASQPPPVENRPPDWEEARRHLDIRGVTRIGRDKTTGRESYFAVVNGRIVEESETVSVAWDGRLYRWRVTEIGPTGLQMVKLDARVE